MPEPRTLLITAGPTHEPIDAVRYLGNRSSGKMGIALADAAAAAKIPTTLLLGPTSLRPKSPQVKLHSFNTTSDLQSLLHTHAPGADVLIMAAAVADYRPKPLAALSGGKFRRTSEKVTLELEPTPDLLAEVGRTRRADQLLIGFALEPRKEMIESARRKVEKKNIDLCIANPLETMDAPDIEAVLVYRDGRVEQGPGRIAKDQFAQWFIARLTTL